MNKRLFVAIDLPQSVRQVLFHLDPRLQGVRWTVLEQMHLTLSFLGNVEEDLTQRLQERLRTIQFGAFFLPVAGVGAFPPKGPSKIIWIGVGQGHPHLFQIYKRVQEAVIGAGLEAELRPWHPHITLARCRNADDGSLRKFLKRNDNFDAGMFPVDSFHLYSSELTPAGPVHTRELAISCSGGLARENFRIL